MHEVLRTQNKTTIIVIKLLSIDLINFVLFIISSAMVGNFTTFFLVEELVYPNVMLKVKFIKNFFQNY